MRKLKTWFLPVLCLALLHAVPLYPDAAGQKPKLVVYFFGASNCHQCQEIKDKRLIPLMREFPATLDIRIFDIETPGVIDLMTKMERIYQVKKDGLQELFLPDTFLIGFEPIMAHGDTLIKKYLSDPSKWNQKPEVIQLFTGKTLALTVQPDQIQKRLTGSKPSVWDYVRDFFICILGLAVILFRKNKWVIRFAQVGLGLIFIISGLGKFGATSELESIITAYQLLPATITPLLAVTLPWMELLAGGLLVAGLFPAIGALLIGGLNLVFIPAIAYRTVITAAAHNAAFFQVSFNCGCGLGDNLAWILILRDIGFFMAAAAIILNRQITWDLPRLLHGLSAKKG